MEWMKSISVVLWTIKIGKEAAAEAKADMEAEMEAVMDERDRTRILKGVGETLKKGANSPVCSAEVRSLAGTAFKSDLDKFEVMAKASLALCRAYVNSFKAQAATASELDKFEVMAKASLVLCRAYVNSFKAQAVTASELDKFEVMAKASLVLCRAYVNSFKAQAATAS
eukprot:gene8957-4019_t